jgi:hypothetical protein
MKTEDGKKREDQPLDDLLSLRGKPFADWKEERKYLRGKWGEQGKKIDPVGKESTDYEKSEKKEDEQS